MVRPGGYAVAVPAPGSRRAGAEGDMAAPRPCADGPCCSHPSAAPGVQQTLDEMDFERGEGACGSAGPAPSGVRRPPGPGGGREPGSLDGSGRGVGAGLVGCGLAAPA